MGLEMRPELDAPLGEIFRGAGDIAIRRGAVDDETGGGEFGEKFPGEGHEKSNTPMSRLRTLLMTVKPSPGPLATAGD
jgi:hypothetical protein